MNFRTRLFSLIAICLLALVGCSESAPDNMPPDEKNAHGVLKTVSFPKLEQVGELDIQIEIEDFEFPSLKTVSSSFRVTSGDAKTADDIEISGFNALESTGTFELTPVENLDGFQSLRGVRGNFALGLDSSQTEANAERFKALEIVGGKFEVIEYGEDITEIQYFNNL